MTLKAREQQGAAPANPVFEALPERFEFAREEEIVLQRWRDCDAFQESMRRSRKANLPLYTFYDGPPFATGMPHYGHILAGTIKDVVTRYAHQSGHHVERRFGWDCHGLPIEYAIDKKLGITSKEQHLAMGIPAYNKECRSIVQKYASEWRYVTERYGRWIDMDNDWKTMNPTFMESVWWVFKSMYDKGLVYQGFKVMPYSTACHTPLSNFEKGQNYKEVADPAVVASFPIVNADPNSPLHGASLLAFTTTPWTLPSNLALCVNANMTYSVIRDNASGALWVCGSNTILKEVYGKAKVEAGKEPYSVVATMPGSDLVGLQYEPIFDYFAGSPLAAKAFVVVSDDYVQEESGTGIVHQAPAFGEDDYRVCLDHGIIQRGPGLICPVDESGRFTSNVPDFAGRYVKEADRDIIRALRKRGRIVRDYQKKHDYPHCWRSDTPLIYKAVPSWFVNVPKIRDRLLQCNEQTYWVPAYVKERRFHNWLMDARDWSVSRTRYWGTPLPIWISDDGDEIVVIGSIAELQERSGRAEPITDLHREFVDEITIPSSKGKGVLRRVEDVFDCWFESGSMPYASRHYPFENADEFERGFPADFIAEGLDQTRGWFYTLMVVSVALFDKPPFQNLICNGLVLAEDGKKMSKSLNNYPDPMLVMNTHGADAMRLYLINSPVVRADSLKFSEAGVRDVVKDVFVPWSNTLRLFISQARRRALKDGTTFKANPDVFNRTDNVMDKWILSSLQTLIAGFRKEMNLYELAKVVPHLVGFIDKLSLWYVRFNKLRIKGDAGPEACEASLCTLYHVLLSMARLMAPFTPFLADTMYYYLKPALPQEQQEDTVHFDMVPDVDESSRDESIERAVAAMQLVVETGRTARDQASVSLRIPLPKCIVVTSSRELISYVEPLSDYIVEQLNVQSVEFSDAVSDYISVSLEPDNRRLGKRLGKHRPAVVAALKAMSHSDVVKFRQDGVARIGEFDITIEDVIVQTTFIGDAKQFVSHSAGEVVVIISREPDDACVRLGQARTLVAHVQGLRKQALLTIEDEVRIFADYGAGSATSRFIRDHRDYVESSLKVAIEPMAELSPEAHIVADDRKEVVPGESIRVVIARR